MKKLLAIAALSLMSFCAFAADLTKRSNAPVSPLTFVNAPISWAGVYAGLSVGYVGTKNTIYIDYADTRYFPDFRGGESMRHRSRSAFGGGEIGYNLQSGSIVYGLFAAATGMSASDKTWSNGACCGSGDDMFTSNLRSINIVGGRLGFAFDRALFYGEAGFALGYSQMNLTDANVRQNGSTSNDSIASKVLSKWLPGLSLGVGMDYALNQSWRVGVNYRYVNFGSPNWNMTTSSYSSNGTYRGEATYLLKTRGLDAHMIGLSAKFYFGGSAAPVVARY